MKLRIESRRTIRALAGASVLLIQTALAQQSSVPETNTVPSTTPAICTDRPTKSDSTCAVPVGTWQVESDLLNFTHQHQDGTTTDTLLPLDPTLKYGIGQGVDLEVEIAPIEFIRTRTQSRSTDMSGVGDVYFRVKDNFGYSSAGAFSMALIPYIKAPTSRVPIGDGAVEEGIVSVFTYRLTPSLSISTGPEVDVLKNAADFGRHTNLSDLISCSESLSHGVTLYQELWTDWNFDPRGTVRQSSIDGAIAWAPSQRLQLDIGLNVGVTHNTPALQVYAGVSRNF